MPKTLKSISEDFDKKFVRRRNTKSPVYVGNKHHRYLSASIEEIQLFYLSAFTEVLEGLKLDEVDELESFDLTYGDTNHKASAVWYGQNLVVQELNDKIKRILD